MSIKTVKNRDILVLNSLFNESRAKCLWIVVNEVETSGKWKGYFRAKRLTPQPSRGNPRIHLDEVERVIGQILPTDPIWLQINDPFYMIDDHVKSVKKVAKKFEDWYKVEITIRRKADQYSQGSIRLIEEIGNYFDPPNGGAPLVKVRDDFGSTVAHLIWVKNNDYWYFCFDPRCKNLSQKPFFGVQFPSGLRKFISAQDFVF